jgi:hypothetical protein
MENAFPFNTYDNIVFKKTSCFYVLYIDAKNDTCMRRLEVGSNQITLHACRSLVALDKVSHDHRHFTAAHTTLNEFVKRWYFDEMNVGTFISIGYMKPGGTYVWTPYIANCVPDNICIFSGELSFSANGSRVRSRTPPPIRSRVW